MSIRLAPLERAEIPLAAAWLADPVIARWLDFGPGQPVLTAPALLLMLQRDQHVIRSVWIEEAPTPIGLVALSSVDRRALTAQLWYLLGDKRYGGRGFIGSAVRELLRLGFRELGLGAINAWAVEQNRASIRILERNHFRPIGRQRRCHSLDGEPVDRLLFDLLASEFFEHESAAGGYGS